MSRAGAVPAADERDVPRDPWERFGWLMWSGWLVFLVFPLTTAVLSDAWWGAQLLSIVATTGFGAAYAWEVVRLSRGRQRTLPVPEPVLVLLLLGVLALATTPAIGYGALSFVPFLQSFGVFALPRPSCWAYAATVLVVTGIATPTLLGGDELTLLFILVGVTAAAVAGRLLGEYGEAYDDARRGQTVAEERDRVARDVHDVLGHSLTVLSIKAELAGRLVDADPERAKAELADITRLSREALGEVRATVGGLRAARLGDEVESARGALAGRGIEAELPVDVRVADPRYRAVMGWVLREAVTNVVRHSGARRCVVRLEERSLVVHDDGHGLHGSREGNGLRGLRERVEAAGGRFRLDDAEGGTRLEVTW